MPVFDYSFMIKNAVCKNLFSHYRLIFANSSRQNHVQTRCNVFGIVDKLSLCQISKQLMSKFQVALVSDGRTNGQA